MILDYFHIGFRNVRKRGIRSFLTLLGIFIGIATVVSLISLGDGLKSAITSQFGITSTETISVQAGGLNSFGPPGSGVVTPLTKEDVEAIARIESVDEAIPRHIETVKAEFNKQLIIGSATNIPRAQREVLYEILAIEPLAGNLLEDTDSNEVVLGNNFYFADKSGFNKAVRVGNTIVLNGEKYRVKGILKKKGSFITDHIILLTDEALTDITDVSESVDLIMVKVKDSSLIEQTQKEIEDLLRKRRNVKLGEEDFEVSTPEAALEDVNQLLTGVQLFVAMIAAISIVVGAIGIINTMTTSVLERTKEIGVMKAIGARNKDIFYQFFIEAGLLGFTGGVMGVILGTLIGYAGTFAINSFLGVETAPTIIWTLVVGALIGSFIIGALSGIIPAMHAANKKPVEALRSYYGP